MKRKKFDYRITYVVIGRPYYFPSRYDAIIYAKRNNIPISCVRVCCEIVEDDFFYVSQAFASNIKQAKINALEIYNFYLLKLNKKCY